jgi:4-hydroxy-2-oxoheptanedioate aldolase
MAHTIKTGDVAMLSPNRVLDAFEKRGVAFGTFVQNNSPENCEIAARSGLDFVIVDMEHGTFGIESAANMIRAVEGAGTAAIVRIPESSRATILKVLDAGAVGIIVPNVESAAQLRDVVAATRYAPNGTRGACPCVRSTAHGVYGWNEHKEWAEKNIMVIALVETRAGVENFEEIVKVEGLDVVGIGQFDLSMSLGYDGDHKHADVVRRQRELNAIALRNGVQVMGAIFDSEPSAVRSSVAQWREQGARFLALSGDRFILADSYRAMSAAAGVR